MDLFDEKNLEKLNKEKERSQEFLTGKLNIQIFGSADPTTSYDSLLHVKYLFQRMLPKMPKDYILRQVFDDHHYSMTLNEKIEGKNNVFRIIGAVLFRPCFERGLVEIVFLAIDSEYHISGYGTFLFNCFKEICKLQYSIFLKNGTIKFNNMIITDLSIFDNLDIVDITQLELKNTLSNENNNKTTITTESNIKNSNYTSDKNLYLLTYADNSAIGFFKKQGFSLKPRSKEWIGYIKDYEGGTLMECKVHKMINYLRKKEILIRLRDIIFNKMRKVNDFHILKDSSERDILRKENIDLSDQLKMRSKEDFLADFLYFVICTLQSHPSSWPFLEPVSEKDVPDYFEVIKHPMDMSLIMKKLNNKVYSSINDFGSDVILMCDNCFSYNGPDTQYYKCAENIQKCFKNLISKYSRTINNWGFGIDLQFLE